MSAVPVLAGDVGGTKTVLALFERSGRRLRSLKEQVYSSGAHDSLEAIVEAFLQAARPPRVEAGCFAVAGRVDAGRAKITNLPWVIEERRLARVLKTRRVRLINDLEGSAYGMLFLPPGEFEVLQKGRRRVPSGTIAVVAPGTGLGEGILAWEGTRHHPMASEGGHTDFGPRNDRDIALLRALRARWDGHVSYERVASGEGLHHLYRFLRDTGAAPEPAWLQDRMAQGDPNATITELALSGESPLCSAALDWFVEILGAEAGNLVLKCLATGGVILAGGIPPKILPALRQGGFLKAFRDKGRFGAWLATLPVRVALNPRAPLLGAAHYLFQREAPTARGRRRP